MKRLLYHWSVPVILLIISGYLYQKPAYNWDMFPYMALTAADPAVSMDSTHTYVYKEAARAMPRRDFDAVAQLQPDRMSSTAAFQEILKYYEIKPGYIVATKLLYYLGFNLVSSTYFISILSYFLIGCIVWRWIMGEFNSLFAFGIALLIMALPFLVLTARYSSPDMLCTLLLLAGLYLMTEVSILAGMILYSLAIAVRPDALILSLLFGGAACWSGKLKVTYALIFSATSIAVTRWIVNGLDILKEFLFTVPAYSQDWTTSELAGNYLHGLQAGAYTMVSSYVVSFTLLTLLTLHIRSRQGISISSDLWALLILAAWAAVFIRYMLHPVVEDRFLIPSYLTILVGLWKSIGAAYAPKNSVI